MWGRGSPPSRGRERYPQRTTKPQEEKAKKDTTYRYSFRLVDLETGLYIAYGYSGVSEKKAFLKALKFLKDEGIPLESVRLDRYYSNRKDLRRLEGLQAEAFVWPRKNLATFGPQWHDVFNRIHEDPYAYAKAYFQREPVESSIGADKARFGSMIPQRCEDRREQADKATAVLHNFFSARASPSTAD